MNNTRLRRVAYSSKTSIYSIKMATLSQVTQSTRTILKWAALVFAAFLLLRLILFPIAQFAFRLIFPKKPPAPIQGFGKLPKISFPKGGNGEELTFTIKTTTGTLPTNIPDSAIAYTTLKPSASFSSYDRAKQKVAKIGFLGEGTPLSSIMHQWKDTKLEGRQITFNTVTEDFTLTSNLSPPSTDGTLPTVDQAIRIAKDFLSALSLLPKDIDDAKTKTTLIKIKNGAFSLATSLSESDLIQVDFYRKPLSDLPIVYPQARTSLMSFLIKGGRDSTLQVAQAHFSYKGIDDKTSSTYPIKTAKEAFEELKQGKGYITLLPVQKTINITKVYLAYYEGNDDIEFFLPVFVFEGEGGFLAFVEAIREQSLQ